MDPDIGRGLCRREPEIDWRSAQGFLPDGTADPEVLAFAADGGRVLVSRDASTIPHHFARFVADRSSPGVILIQPRIGIGEAIERILIAWLSWTAEDMENQIRWLPN